MKLIRRIIRVMVDRRYRCLDARIELVKQQHDKEIEKIQKRLSEAFRHIEKLSADSHVHNNQYTKEKQR